MKQEDINMEWWKEFDANVGRVTMLIQPRHVTPGLRKPYEWLLQWDEVDATILHLRGIANNHKARLQCDLVKSKSLAFGKRVEIFLLGYRPGFCGDDGKGVTQEEWSTIGDKVRLALRYLDGAKPYIEPWSADKKFELRFEAYIAIKEMNP
jgi:hypothetical protein